MGLLDLKTIVIIGLMLHSALALVMLQTYFTRKTYPGFRTWTIGQACWVLASFFFYFRDVIVSESVSVILANPLYLLYALLLRNGMARFYGYDRDRLWMTVNVCVAVLCLALIYWFRFGTNDMNMRVIGSSLGMAFIVLCAGIEPILNKVKRYQIQMIISAALMAGGVCLLMRGAASAVHPVYSDLFRQDVWLKFVLVMGMFVNVIQVFGFITLMHSRLEDELLEAQARLQDLANTDALTGLVNRRGITEIATHDLKLARRYGHKVSLIIFDLDHFKAVNDTYGHAMGDEVLAAIGSKCLDAMRDVDTLARWGGEEFAVLMPQTDLVGARQTAERLRIMISAFKPVPGMDIRTTASFGVAELNGGSFEDMVERADSCLYQAKREGRDRVCVTL
ncbi:MAG: GGDEF domain-containing protein [Desulfovibrio sp.]|nr:GGDEF domain-containing protein [Desulfovibrio sp.]MBI4958242.1 GGDEF domain-containing protein [Desulfovibrio sp.]